MSEFALCTQLPLDGYKKQFDSVSLTELTHFAIVSIATPRTDRGELSKALDSAFKVAIPSSGCSNLSENREYRLLGLQRDQMFLLLAYGEDDVVGFVRDNLGASTAYYSDQSDSWAMLRITGPGCRTALERICMLDLSTANFPLDTVSRTIMDHLSVIILHDDAESFILLSLRSSAKSFLHAVEESIINTS